MSEPQTPEIPKPNTAGSKETASVSKDAQELLNRFRQAKTPREGLEKTKEVIITEEDVKDKEIIDGRISEGVDALAGTRMESLGKNRKENALELQRLKSKFLKDGIDGLDDDELGFLRGQVNNAIVRKEIEMGMITEEEAQGREIDVEVVDDILRQPGFVDAVRQAWHDRVNVKPVKTEESQLQELQAKTDSMFSKKIDSLTAEIKSVEDQAREFQHTVVEKDSDGNVITRPGKKWETIVNAQSIMAEDKADYDAKAQIIASKMQQLAGPVNRDLDLEVQRLQVELNDTPYVMAKKEYDALTKEEGELIQKRTGLLEERYEYEFSHYMTSEDMVPNSDNGKESNDTSSNAARASSEEIYVHNLSTVYEGAADKWIETGLVDTTLGSTEKILARAATETDPMTRSLLEAMVKHWGTVSIKDGKPDMSGLDKNKIKIGMSMLSAEDPRIIALGIVNPYTGKFYTTHDLEGMTEDGIKVNFEGRSPEYLMTNMLLAQDNPETGEKWTPQDIADKRQSDPDFFLREQNDVIVDIAKKSVMSNGLASLRNLRNTMENSEWGNDALKSIIDSDSFQAEIKSVTDQMEAEAIKMREHMSEGKEYTSFEAWAKTKFKKGKEIGKGLVKSKVFWAFMGGGPGFAAFVMYREYKMELLTAKEAQKKKDEAAKAGGEHGHPPDHHDDSEEGRNKRAEEAAEADRKKKEEEAHENDMAGHAHEAVA